MVYVFDQVIILHTCPRMDITSLRGLCVWPGHYTAYMPENGYHQPSWFMCLTRSLYIVKTYWRSETFFTSYFRWPGWYVNIAVQCVWHIFMTSWFGWLLVLCLYKEDYLQIFKCMSFWLHGCCGQWEGWAFVKRFNHTSGVAVVTPTGLSRSAIVV